MLDFQLEEEGGAAATGDGDGDGVGTRGPGPLLTDFLIGREIGRGGFGVVRLAKVKLDGALVALKAVNRKDLGDDEDGAKRLRMEVCLQARLSHPHILPLLGHFVDEERVYLIMPFAAGGDLFGELRGRGKLDEPRAGYVLGHVASALAYLHSLRVGHRDIKAENVLLTRRGEPLLADFGYSVSGRVEMRTSGVGTRAYAGPELTSTDEPYNALLADLWSLGILAFAVLFADLPFKSLSDARALRFSFPGPSLGLEAEGLSGWEAGVGGAGGVSVGAREFYKSLIRVNPEERIAAATAAELPWVRDMTKTYRNRQSPLQSSFSTP